MSSKRRYPVGKFKIYDKTFDRRRIQSGILNAGSQRASVNSKFFDEQSCKNLELQFLGADTKKGKKYFRNEDGDLEEAYLWAAEARLKELDKKFQDYQDQCMREGRTIPEEWPPELLAKKLKAEAIMDILTEELGFIQSLLKEYEQKTEVKVAKNILLHGPVGMGKMRGGILSLIDGQPIKQLESGHLIIDCPTSPFHCMAVSDYRNHIVRPYLTQKNELHERLRRQAMERELSGREGGYPANARPPMPSWPTGIKKHKLEEE